MEVDVGERAVTFRRSGAKVEFPYPVWATEVMDDVVVVLIQPPVGAEKLAPRNVYAFDVGGARLWQIPEFRMPGIYTGIAAQEGVIVAYHWSGHQVWLEPRTGAVLREEFVK